MIGMSHYCWNQWNAARTRPPHLKAIVAYDGATDMYRDWMYHGGIPIQGFLNAWLFGSILLLHKALDIGFRQGRKDQVIYDMYDHPFDDEWQRRRSPFWELSDVDIPVFSIGVWGKAALHLRGNVEGFARVRAQTAAHRPPRQLRPGAALLLRRGLPSPGDPALVRPSPQEGRQPGDGPLAGPVLRQRRGGVRGEYELAAPMRSLPPST